MKRSSLYLARLVALVIALPAGAQTFQRRPAQSPPAAETQKQERTVTALPAAEEDMNEQAKDRLTIHQLKRKMDAKEDIVILDVRSHSAYLGSTVKIRGAVRIPLEQIEERLSELPKEKEIIIYCT
jgi:3-mercaptopyruvate sulfurtransferase SseA